MVYRFFKLFALMYLVVSFALVTTSCTSTVEPLETEEDFLGFITEISPLKAKDLVGQILVESHADKLVTKYLVTIRGDTMIFNQEGKNLRQVDFQALVEKQWVKIWFDGPIAESFPMKGTALQIVITSTP